jgi:hypothetical protein
MFLEDQDLMVRVVADESFVSLEDACTCARHGILLNFKLQKIGGILYAFEIEEQLHRFVDDEAFQTTVGGTFPTAIGRTYDQQGASVLRYAELPSDAWEPSTNWFTDDKHLIQESFVYDREKELFLPLGGHGLGVTPNWDKIDALTVRDPRAEYQAVRQGMPGEKININLRDGADYAATYRSLTGRPWDWNLK